MALGERCGRHVPLRPGALPRQRRFRSLEGGLGEEGDLRRITGKGIPRQDRYGGSCNEKSPATYGYEAPCYQASKLGRHTTTKNATMTGLGSREQRQHTERS